MKTTHLLWLGVGLAACVTPERSGDDVYRTQAVATLTSFDCSQRTVADLGYRPGTTAARTARCGPSGASTKARRRRAATSR